MRPEATYNNSGKSSYANFEIGPELNKPYVQVVKQQVKMHQDDLHEILVKLHIKFISSELRLRRYEQNKLNMALMQNTYKHQENTTKQGCNMLIWNYMQNQATFI